ncbi:MAG: hypothetical protein IJ588_08410, partial [Prevotella sp.]|nr:hypothetical protein [Prevotella sp.]
MNMKRWTMVMALLVAVSTGVSAQGFLKKLKDKAIEKVKEKVENKVERTVSDEMDDVLDGKSNKSSKKSQSSDADYEEAEATDEGPVDFAQIQAKSDFKRGATVFFTDDLSGEQMGEFPSKWDLLQGSEVEVVSIKGKKAIKF